MDGRELELEGFGMDGFNALVDMLLDRLERVYERIGKEIDYEVSQDNLMEFARTAAMTDEYGKVEDMLAGMLFDLDDRELFAISLGAAECFDNEDAPKFAANVGEMTVSEMASVVCACCCGLSEFANGILTGEEVVSKAGPWVFLSAYMAYVRKNRKGGYDVLRLKQHEYLWSVCYASLSKEDCAGEFEDGMSLHLYWQGILEKALESDLFADKYGYVFDGEVLAMKKMMELTADPYKAHGKDMG